MECEEENDLKADLTQSLNQLLRDKLKGKSNVDIDCLLCISQRDEGKEFTVKIHDFLFPTKISNNIETISVGIQVENVGDDPQVKAGENGNNVSLEDTLSKGMAEIPCKDDQDKAPDGDNLSDTTAPGSSRSATPEDPAEQVTNIKSEGHPEKESDQIDNVQGTRKAVNPVGNGSQEIDDLQNVNVLNSVGMCDSTVADTSNVGDPTPDVITTPLDTGDGFEEPNITTPLDTGDGFEEPNITTSLDTGDGFEEPNEKDQARFEERGDREPASDIQEYDNPFEDLSHEFDDDIQDNEDQIPDDIQNTETYLVGDKVENPIEDLSQEFDDAQDTEAKMPDDIQNTERHLTSDKVEQDDEEENRFESPVQMSVPPSDQRLECTITAVEGQFDDISEESQTEETEMGKLGSVITPENEVTSIKDTVNIEMTSEAMEEIKQNTTQENALHDDGTNLNIGNVVSVNSEEHLNVVQDSPQGFFLQSDGSNLNIENVVSVQCSEDHPEIAEKTTLGTGTCEPSDQRFHCTNESDTATYSLQPGEVNRRQSETCTNSYSLQPTEVNRRQSEIGANSYSSQPTEVNRNQSGTVANDGDSDDIVVIEDEEDEIGNNVAEESQPPVAAQPEQEEEDDIQMTWEKPPSPRKRSYPFNDPLGSSSALNSNIDTGAEGYRDLAAGYNNNMNRTSVADCGNGSGTNALARTLSTPNSANRSNIGQRSSSQITVDSSFNQRPSGEASSIELDGTEFKCGICNFKSTVYVELLLHLETQHSFEMFLSCVLCHEYFPNRSTFTIHRQMAHQDKDYFRCPHCGNGFGTEECMYHRQECKAQQFGQPATNTSGTIHNLQSRQVPQQNIGSRQSVTKRNTPAVYASGNVAGRGYGFQNTQARQLPPQNMRRIANRNPQGNYVYPSGRQVVSQNRYQATNISSSRARSLPAAGIERTISSSGQLSGIQMQNRQQQTFAATARSVSSTGQMSGIPVQNRQQQQQQQTVAGRARNISSIKLQSQQQQQTVGGTVRNISTIPMQNRQQQQQIVGGTVRNISSVQVQNRQLQQQQQQQQQIVFQWSGVQMQNRQKQQPQHQSPIKVARFSSVPARSVLGSPVSLPTSVRPQSAPPRRKLDRSIQYICDQCNTSLPSLKDYETHCLNAHNRYVCPVCSGSFPSKKLADKHLSQHSV